jgi:3-oxoacyl-[acyl-carrier protein] reductase
LRLKGQVALVTGASRGIGEVIALHLAKEGVKVAVNYHTGAEAASMVVSAITSAGGEALPVGADVSQEKDTISMVDQVIQTWGQLDILVNNAGITRDKLLIRMTAEEWDAVINVNLRGAYICTKTALPHMIRRRRGRIVNISSIVGVSGNPGQANYAASKAGLIGFTKAMAREVASRNITVNAVAPGYITTTMVQQLSDEVQKRILDKVPMARFGTPEDVAETVVFLCTDSAGYITGQVIGIDGGLGV